MLMRAALQFHLAHRQRTESVRIAGDDDAVFREKHQRKRAFQLQQRVAQSPGQRAFAASARPDGEPLRYRCWLGRSRPAFQVAAQFERRW